MIKQSIALALARSRVLVFSYDGLKVKIMHNPTYQRWYLMAHLTNVCKASTIEIYSNMCSWKSAWISHFHLFVLSKSFSGVGNRLANENGINSLALRMKAIMKAFSGFAHCSQYYNLPTEIKNQHKRVGIQRGKFVNLEEI